MKRIKETIQSGYLTLGVILAVLVFCPLVSAQPADGEAPRYQGQTTPADLGDSVESNRMDPVVTYEGADEQLPEQEAGFESRGVAAGGFHELWAQRGLAMQRGDKSQEYRLLAQLIHLLAALLVSKELMHLTS